MSRKNRVRRFSPTKLKRRRMAIGCSHEEVDSACQFPPGSTARFEDGKVPSVDDLNKMLAALDIHYDDVMALA